MKLKRAKRRIKPSDAAIKLHNKNKNYSAILYEKIFRKVNIYKKNMNEYKDKIINYAESPNGKAYVGINKAPFMPAANNGHGFQGVLIQDKTRSFIQCHACGSWMQKNSHLHLKKCCGLTTQEYKEKYGLNASTGLVSDATSLRLTQNALKNKKLNIDNFKKIVESGFMSGKHGRQKSHSIEYMNQFGTCPLQLKTRLYEFILCNRELPSQGNRGRQIYKALKRRYGSYSHALTVYGLPFMKRCGTNMTFIFNDGTVYKYNINQFYDREELYVLLIEKCPELSMAGKIENN